MIKEHQLDEHTGGFGARLLIACLLLGMFIPRSSPAQIPQFSGFLRLDKRFNVRGDSVSIADFYNRFRLEIGLPLGEKLYAFSSVDFRFYDLPQIESLADLEDLNREFPTELSLWETYIDIYGFLSKNFDMRIGKQRLAWGTADKLNHTDNLNPDDFSDLVNFTEKIPTWAVKGMYYLGEVTLTGVWLPTLTPILLPRKAASLFLGSGAEGFQDSLALPVQQLRNSMFAFKFSSRFGKWDYSLSYFQGYDDIPILRATNIRSKPDRDVVGRLDLGFPRMKVIGLDFATELLGAGFWGDGAVFFPEKVLSETTIGNTTRTDIELNDKPYFKFTFGVDYTFPNGLYMNGQWMHGFFTERGTDALHDYFFLELEKKLFHDEVKITLATGLEIASWDNPGASYGYGIFPELTYLVIDNLEMNVGAFVIVTGKPETLFGNWKNADQAYVSLKVTF